MKNLLTQPKFKKFIEELTQLRNKAKRLSLDEERALSTQFFLSFDSVSEPVRQVEDLTIPMRDGATIPLRLFLPKTFLHTLVYFHGGGWVFGTIQESDATCRKLANHLHCAVVSVGYRLAPESRFPTPLHDCYDATLWVLHHARRWQGDPSRISVCGESAGGNLAAAVALMARDTGQIPLSRQLLFYPALCPIIHNAPYDNSADQYFLTKSAMKYFWRMYLRSIDDKKQPYAAPLQAKDLSGLPPTLLVTGEYDPLETEGLLYAEQLQKAGVQTIHLSIPQAIHGFLDLPIYTEQQKNERIEKIATQWTKL